MDASGGDPGRWLFIGLCVGALIVLVAWGFQAFSPIDTTCSTDCLNARDLSAQESMAKAAWGMILVTFISSALGAWSLYLIRENLVEARKVSREAQRSAKAAEEAVAEAQRTTTAVRETAMTQMRAYISVTGMEREIGGKLDVRLHLANAGQSPARSIRVELSVTYVSGGDTLLTGQMDQAWSDLPSGGEDQVDFRVGAFIDNREIRQQINGEIGGVISAVGTIHYSDIFDREWRETFAYRSEVVPSRAYDPVDMERVAGR